MATYKSVNICSSPQATITASLSATSRVSYDDTKDKIIFSYTITGHLQYDESKLGTGNTITGTFSGIPEYDGKTRDNSVVVKASSAGWSGKTKYTTTGTFYKIINKDVAGSFSVKFTATGSWGSPRSASPDPAWISISIPAPLYTATYTDGEPQPKSVVYYTNVAPDCPFTKEGYSFSHWEQKIEGEGPKLVVNPGDSFSLNQNYIFQAIWNPIYVKPSFGNINAYRDGEYVYLEFSYTPGYNASLSAPTIIVDNGEESYNWTEDGENKYKTNELALDAQYDITVSFDVTNLITGGIEKMEGATFVSANGVAIDINREGNAVCFGNESPDKGDLTWIDKGVYIAEDWDIYMAKDNIGSVAMALTTPASLPYCSCRGAGTMSSTTSPSKVTLTSAGLIARSSTDDFLISDGGLKCVRAGVVMVSGNVYYSTTAAAANIGVYIYKGTAEITSTYYEGVAGAVSCAPIIIPVEAGEILYLYERASTSCTIHKENVATHLDVIYLA